MATTAYNLHLKGHLGGADFDRNAVDRTLAANSGKRLNVLIDSLGGSLASGLSIVNEFYNLDSIMGHLRCYIDYEKYALYLVVIDLTTLCYAKNATTR